MNKVSYCDFMDAIRAWDVQKVNSLISMVLQSRKPLSDYTYPTLRESVNALYAHFTEYGTQKNFAADYWQVLPDEESDMPVLPQGGDDTHASVDK